MYTIRSARPSAVLPTASCEVVTLSDGEQLFCRLSDTENGDPPLLFLHGNRDNHTHFAELISLLEPSVRCVAIDLRGHGLSSKPDCPLSAEQCAADLHEVIDHFGWPLVTLVGHSLGAVTSMVYALCHPERVNRIILMGAAAHYEMKWKRPEVTEETYPQVIAESNKRAAPFFFLDEYPQVARRVIASWSTVPFAVHKNLIKLTHPDLRADIPRISAPTLVVAGERDRSTSVESAGWLAENLPDGILHVVPRTGHFMFMENPAHVAEVVSEFLNLPRPANDDTWSCGCGSHHD